MKQIFACVFTLLTLSASAFGNWKQIKGNGNLKKETREVSNFTKLSNSGSMNVVISYGSSNSITVEADENLLEYIETNVEDNKLKIKTKDKIGISSKNKITINVQMTKVEGLALSGSGNIHGNGSFSNDGKSLFAISGSGSIHLSFTSFGSIGASISGSGDINLSNGNTTNIDISISGSGNIDAASVTADNVVARISGSGNIKAKVNNSIEASIAGSGNIYYTGNADKIKTHVAGSGKVKKV